METVMNKLTPQCSHCSSQNLGPVYTEDFTINGNDDPQYSGGWETIQQRDCLECGELGVWENKPYHLPIKFLANKAAWGVWIQSEDIDIPGNPESFPCFAFAKVTRWHMRELKGVYIYADDVVTMMLSLDIAKEKVNQ